MVLLLYVYVKHIPANTRIASSLANALLVLVFLENTLWLSSLIHAAHCVHSVAVCSTVATLLCEGNDCRCVWKPLVGMTRCELYLTNKHYGFYSE